MRGQHTLCSGDLLPRSIPMILQDAGIRCAHGIRRSHADGIAVAGVQLSRPWYVALRGRNASPNVERILSALRR
jgi:hypothetical protein